MHTTVTNSTAANADVAVNDLSPLAWVLEELRKSLESASKALKRFSRDAEAARGTDLAAIDASQLRTARQQLHQAVGAMEMVGLPGPVLLLSAMETAVQKFLQLPDLCSPEAVEKIEYASFALTEYLEGLLAEKPVSAVSLFPQYRDVQEMLQADRVHPADLWTFEWQWNEPKLAAMPAARQYDAAARTELDQSVLQLMKGKAPQAGVVLRDLSLGFAAGQTEKEPKVFWMVAAGYFDAIAHDLVGSDVYVRRAASRILLQYATLAKGDSQVSERLALDLLFFCAQAVGGRASDTPALAAVRTAYGLSRFKPVDYEQVQFGRFDPALLMQARKRIVAAKESWSSLCAGEVTKMKAVADQFSLVVESLRKLHEPSEPLALALTDAVDVTVRSRKAPAVHLAMEVATSVLYLEAMFEDLDPSDPQLLARTSCLAERLEWVRNGGQPQPLEVWMEELYRRVSDKKTMGNVVNELRVSLGELEKALDLFFRNPKDKTELQAVPGQLAQMRGVLSVLGLDQASKAVFHMKANVEQMLVTDIDERQARSAGTFEHLGSNLGALSFLIDMLNYQPALAKKLFVYDEAKDEFKPVMGRLPAKDEALSVTVSDDVSYVEPTFDAPAVADPAKPALLPVEAVKDIDAVEIFALDSLPVLPLATSETAGLVAPASASEDFEEDDLQDIFLDEAREVIGTALQALDGLSNQPADPEHMTVLRRAFHTLKGSARMVGFTEFGEAAWSMEQMLNSWLADQKAASKEFRTLCSESIQAFSRWVADIQAKADAGWSAAPFHLSADAMRNESRYLALDVANVATAPTAGVLAVPVDSTESVQLNIGEVAASTPAQAAADETVKVIDGLRIGIPLFNVYLSEADEWSRRLVNEVAEWSLESHQPISATTVAFAHSLAGSSATVGFTALSELARLFEQALDDARNHVSKEKPAYVQLFVDASEDIRRLLHQFAAGFLKTPQPEILEGLKSLDFSDLAASAAANAEAGLFDASIEATPAFVDSTSTIVVLDSADAALPETNLSAIPTPTSNRVVNLSGMQDGDDDIDAVDVIDPDLFPIFEEECAELMPKLGTALRQWADTPSDQDSRLEVLRVLHTLKGSARLAGAMRLGEMAHRIESEIIHVGSAAAVTQDFEPLLNRFDGMQNTFDVLRQPDSETADQAFAAVPESAPLAKAEPVQPVAKQSVASKAGANKQSVPAPQSMEMQQVRQAANATIRVRTQLLDRMVNQAGEVMISRSRLEAEISQLRLSLNDMTGSLTRLRQQLRDIELQAETQMQSRLALAKEAMAGFDPLEFDRFTRVQELTRMMAESVNDVATVQRTLQRTIEATEDDLIAQGRQARELQRDLLRTRMVEFDSVSDRLYRVVRQASKETGKQVRLDMQGGNLEMDRGMLDRMLPAFEHLLRNCVTHGVEMPDVRTKAGKDPVGLITVQLRQEGNDISVKFTDDGGGLDLKRIRQKGVKQGLITAEQAKDEQAAANLIFLPGFSTAEEVTELAGRGIGMDVVRTEVMALGGRISTSTVAAKGTNFTLMLPLTTAVTQVVMVRSGILAVGVPASVI